MEEEREVARYWCHGCSQIVDPILEVETIKCSLCRSEFVEEMESIRNDHRHHHHHHLENDLGGGSDSDRALSLWAPILLGMMTNPRRRRRFRHLEFDDDDEDHHDLNVSRPHRQRVGEGETELDRELESIMLRRRRRSSATILQLLQGIRAGIVSESEISVGSNLRDRDRDRDWDGRRENRDRERVILINPFNQTIIVQGGSFDSNNSQNPIGSLGDYFVGPGLELLLQHLAENNPNRYGTPPAQKEAVEALLTVKVEENCLQCSVCLEDFEIGTEAKEMPCKHRFHGGCIFPWLELHSSCPVCRYQLPYDESKLDRDREQSRDGGQSQGHDHEREEAGNGATENRTIEETNNGNGEAGDGDERNDSGRRFSVSLPWPFSSLFSWCASQTANTSSSSSSSSSSSGSSTNANANA